MRFLIPPVIYLLLLLPMTTHGASDIYGPKPFDQILASSFSTNWTASNATAVSSIANLKHVILLDAATKILCLSIDTSNSRNSSLTVTPAGNITATYGSAMRCMFQLRDRNTETIKTTSLNGNYSIHPELFSYSAIDGNATSSASTATSLMVRDIKSIYRSSNATTYLVFTITGNATSAKIKATERLVLSSGNFSTSGTWGVSHWVMMNGTSVSLTTNEANATSFFMADATKLINFEIASGSDFNPNGIIWQTNAFAAHPTGLAAPWTFETSSLISTANNGLIKAVDPAYAAQLHHSANATLAAETALENIRISLAANGESLRYDKEVYLAFRENALSHVFASGDIFNGQFGNRTVAHVYFTNAANATTGIRHPYMVIATHNATPRPNFLVDVARPPGDGVEGSGYANQTVTRTAVLEARTIVVPLKDYGLITNLTDNVVSPSLASDANVSAGNYTTENYADNASSGIAIDGVKIYPAINNTLAYAPAAGEITSSGAHVGRGGSLHWHADGHGFNGNGINLYNLADYSDSQGVKTHPPIIGFSYDGIAIYGKYEAAFNSMEGCTEPLDEYGGHSHGEYGYHYHAHAKQIENGSNDFTQHFLMVGAWKGQVNALPVMGEAEITVKPGQAATTQRYVGMNGTASTIPVVLPATINGTVSTAVSTSVTAAYSPTNYTVANGTLPVGLSLNATTGAITGTPTTATLNSTVVLVRATNASGNGTGNLTFTIAKGNQTISGVAPTLSLATGAAPYSLNASVSSNLTLSYSSSNTSVATVASNGTVTVVGAGATILTVSQDGNSNYDPASSVTQTLTVTSASPVETWKTAYFGPNASISALSADPDADGYTNAYEFAFGGNPRVSGTSSTTSAISNGNFTFSFQKRKNLSDATYEVRMISDLSLGFASGNLISTQTSSPQPDGIEADYEQVEAVIPTSTSKGFLRVQATLP